jgi:hypothetical protein
MTAQRSAVSWAFGVGETSLCLLSPGDFVRTIQPRRSSPPTRRLTLDFSRYNRPPICPWVMASPLSNKMITPPLFGSHLVHPCQAVLVLGTTVGAVIAACMLLEKNYAVYIVERSGAWCVEHIKGRKIEAILAKVKSHPSIEIFMDSELIAVSG